MKSLRSPLALVAMAFAPVTFLTADEISDELNLALQRDRVRATILQTTEKLHESGQVGPEKVALARMCLYEYRRDSAVGLPNRIRQQELVVQTAREYHDILREKVNSGTGSEVDRLQALDRFLAARQLLAELKAGKSSG